MNTPNFKVQELTPQTPQTHDIIWSTITEDLPALIAELEKIVTVGDGK